MNSSKDAQPITVTLYRWAGKWGPFKVNIPCGECSLTVDVLKDTFNTELAGIPIELDIREWLSEWWKPLPKGGWHAPIVMVEGKIISQGHALNRGILTEAIIDAYAHRSDVEGTHLYGKQTCPHCKRAKQYFEQAGIKFQYHDVVREPRALYEMLARVKPIVGPKTPITVPQIWINGKYVGGADQLAAKLGIKNVEPNPERGANSLAPAGRFETVAVS